MRRREVLAVCACILVWSGVAWQLLQTNAPSASSHVEPAHKDQPSDADPPSRFQSDTTTTIHFVNDGDLLRICGPDAGACGGSGGFGITIPNPCTWRRERGFPRYLGDGDYLFVRGAQLGTTGWGAEDADMARSMRECDGVDHCHTPYTIDDEEYAQMLCHELGHVNGWGGAHPQDVETPRHVRLVEEAHNGR